MTAAILAGIVSCMTEDALLYGGGEMGALMRTTDWSATVTAAARSLGPTLMIRSITVCRACGAERGDLADGKTWSVYAHKNIVAGFAVGAIAVGLGWLLIIRRKAV